MLQISRNCNIHLDVQYINRYNNYCAELGTSAQ